MSAEKKVATEVAEAEFERFLEAMDLVERVDAKQYDGDDLKNLLDVKRIVIGAIERGSLVIDPAGQPIYTPQVGNTNSLTFHEPTTNDVVVIDQARSGHDVEKRLKVLAAITGQNRVRFNGMLRRDQRVCLALVELFLA